MSNDLSYFLIILNITLFTFQYYNQFSYVLNIIIHLLIYWRLVHYFDSQTINIEMNILVLFTFLCWYGLLLLHYFNSLKSCDIQYFKSIHVFVIWSFMILYYSRRFEHVNKFFSVTLHQTSNFNFKYWFFVFIQYSNLWILMLNR